MNKAKSQTDLSKQLEAEAQRSVLKGCAIVVMVAVALLVGAVFWGGAIAQEWADAKPGGMSDSAWSQKSEMCKHIRLNATECSTKPSKEVEAQYSAVRATELKDLCEKNSRGDAIVEAQDLLRATLKSPVSANFVSASTTTKHEGCFWTVSGQVDAQNSFGALLRSNYYVKLQLTGKNIWLPLSVRVD